MSMKTPCPPATPRMKGKPTPKLSLRTKGPRSTGRGISGKK